jgi:farnesyl-diphosphate farnesyltransferase
MTNRWNQELRTLLWDMLRKTSRTFYLSIRQLPGEVGDSLCLAYLMLRVSDYLEDNETMAAEEKVLALQCWHDVMLAVRPAEDLSSTLPAMDIAQNPDLLAAQNAKLILQALSSFPDGLKAMIIGHVCDSTLGMARWVKRGPIFLNEADLDDYMHEVAGRVGYLSTEVFAWHYPAIRAQLDRLMPMARETGLALQTVNIIRGLRKDYERGWVFIPETYCTPFNLKPGEIFNPDYEIQALQIVDLMAQKAQRHLEIAVEYICCLPPWLYRLRLACIWPMLFAVRTLAISRRNLKVLVGEVKITRDEVKRIVFDTSLMGWSNLWVTNYYQKLQKIPEA